MHVILPHKIQKKSGIRLGLMTSLKETSLSAAVTRSSSRDDPYMEDDIRVAYSRKTGSAHDRSLHVSCMLLCNIDCF